MNQLSIEKRSKIIQLLVEGNSIRSCSRIMNVSKCTVTKLLVATGKKCIAFHDKVVRKVRCKRLEMDELWSYVYAKEKTASQMSKRGGKGDAWIWIAMDADTKLIVSWFVGNRDFETANIFMADVARRITGRTQITTDGFYSYPEAIRVHLDNVDYCQHEKIYGIRTRANGLVDKRRQYIRSTKTIVSGNPDVKTTTTSHIERQNLTIRMNNRRFARRTNAFSKKMDNHCCSLGLTFAYYNFIRPHQTLKVTPAMKAGLTKRFMTFKEIVELA